MNIQEFLAMSLPFELHGITANRLALINGIEYEKELPIVWRGEKFSGRCGFGIMPILHPLSDLTKEIEHKGEKFVPIVELAKLAFPKQKLFELYNGYVKLDFNYSFHYIEREFSFSCKHGFNGNTWDYDCFIPNQLPLFQKLAELHFNLMDKSEPFVDVNTLETNPYK